MPIKADKMNIPLPPIPDLDAYLAAYSGWVVDLIGHNLIFFSLLTMIIKWVVNKTPGKWDDKLLISARAFIAVLLRRIKLK